MGCLVTHIVLAPVVPSRKKMVSLVFFTVANFTDNLVLCKFFTATSSASSFLEFQLSICKKLKLYLSVQVLFEVNNSNPKKEPYALIPLVRAMPRSSSTKPSTSLPLETDTETGLLLLSGTNSRGRYRIIFFFFPSFFKSLSLIATSLHNIHSGYRSHH